MERHAGALMERHKASLVTPRHAVRGLWNKNGAWKWCAGSGNQLFVCPAEDQVFNGGNSYTELNLQERYAVACHSNVESSHQKKDLPRIVELAKGMIVLVTQNLETDLDLTNGACGVIINIILHKDEPPRPEIGLVHLKYLPALYMGIKVERA
ncbi:hypothetical protein PHLCEN_2v9331 [Hermanssonia centrifuga]|uniref:Uncharacterized protein n=1 Tax=Hermanssonia centrifuga TaxID=98765 RepID=A0A2R6NRV5_9APHY|nr:hypothetical protein PHLCEN_2v9331 [Hermanssonia centrifuga]